MNNTKLDKFFQKIVSDKKVRQAITRESHEWFFSVYFSHHITYETAPFQKEMFSLTEDTSITTLIVVAARGSGKSTIMTLSLPLWAVLGKLKKKHVLILAQTMPQAKQHLKNIREELESNDILRGDLGPFQEDEDEWRSQSLVIPRYGARITAASTEQGIRGIKHGAYRPDLVILDDIEDINSVKTKESRDKTFNWVMGDVMPIGDKTTKFVFVGNLLHEDSLLMKLRKNMADGKMDGAYREYPIMDSEGRILWPGKYNSAEDIEAEKKKTISDVAFQREFMLKIIPDEDCVVRPEWIHRYEELPAGNFSMLYTGVDLAVSKKDSADYTAMVSIKSYGYGKNLKMYILPNPINRRIDYPEQIKQIEMLYETLGGGYSSKFFIESNNFQSYLAQEMKIRKVDVEEVRAEGDKRSRIASISHLIENGTILFPKEGAEYLISQLTGFGVEKHDDLADAFFYAVNATIKEGFKPRCSSGNERLDKIDGGKIRARHPYRQFGKSISYMAFE
jgi:predicted phage terminase large subunit-like protein